TSSTDTTPCSLTGKYVTSNPSSSNEINEHGVVSVEDVKRALREDTILVSIIHVNNETGAIQPVAEIGTLLSNHPKIRFHVDHVQGIGKVPLDLYASHIDLCSISGHKFHSVKGTGLLYVRDGVRLDPILSGGQQELKYRSGTENLPGIVAMVKALRMTMEQVNEKAEVTIRHADLMGVFCILSGSLNQK
ncbi:aminotransferase class V-fold PLP-dependent enzyme, partial [Escherichia sp. TWPC-MK]